MNLLGHVRIALHASDHELHVLGAVLPDLESLVGQRLEAARARPEVAAGIAIHHATDAAFHGDRRFTTGSIALTRALMARGIGRGPSRAVGHAGWELLLDGSLVDDELVTSAFAAAIGVVAELAAAEPVATDRLRWFADRHAEQPIWAAYDDPIRVADRLHRQLARRPLLSFPLEQRATVAEELGAAVAGIRAVGPSLIDDISRGVHGG